MLNRRRSPDWYSGFGTQTQRNNTMRFMVIVKANNDSEAGVLPDEKVARDGRSFVGWRALALTRGLPGR